MTYQQAYSEYLEKKAEIGTSFMGTLRQIPGYLKNYSKVIGSNVLTKKPVLGRHMIGNALKDYPFHFGAVGLGAIGANRVGGNMAYGDRQPGESRGALGFGGIL